jgi:ribose 5-phosphate isomerase B
MKLLKELKIAISNDHAGYDLKLNLVKRLQEQVAEIKDFGCFSPESCDYPDFAHPMAEAVANGSYDLGISLCGSGNGINMTVNKHQGVRAALCWKPEIAALAREHNNANIISLPARFICPDEAYGMVLIFFTTDFEGGRHQKRIDKIPI